MSEVVRGPLCAGGGTLLGQLGDKFMIAANSEGSGSVTCDLGPKEKRSMKENLTE
jgi:hypothetical protein